MTSEGSVFVFEVQDFDLAKTQMEEWKNGLYYISRRNIEFRN